VTEFPVRLIDHIHSGDFGADVHLDVVLPFPPSIGLGLGFLIDSEFNTDEYRIKRLHWNAVQKRFLADVDDGGHWGTKREAQSHFRDRLSDGWRWHNRWMAYATPEDAIEDQEGEYVPIELDGQFFQVSPDDLWCLDTEGRAYRRLGRP
jgi:hypothetical protein